MQLFRCCAVLFSAGVLMLSVAPVGAQERTLEEVKQEVLRRAPRINPFEGVKREDAEAIVKSLTSTDRDHWAEQWCRFGLKYEAEGDALVKPSDLFTRLAVEVSQHQVRAGNVGRGIEQRLAIA